MTYLRVTEQYSYRNPLPVSRLAAGFWFYSFSVTTEPQQLTSQSSLEPFRLLVTQLVCSRRHARQPTRCEECTRSVRHVFVGGRCGGAAPAQGRAEGPTAQNTTMRGEGRPLLASFRVANQLRLSSYVFRRAADDSTSTSKNEPTRIKKAEDSEEPSRFRVTHQGFEPRTRGLRVRCSAS